MTGKEESHRAAGMKTKEKVVPAAKLIGDRIEVSCQIQGLPTKVSWDTGAQVSLTCEAWLTEHLPSDSYKIHSAEELIQQGLYLTAAGGGDIPYSGYTELSVRLGKSDQAREIIVPFLVTKSKYDIPLLGSNTMDVLLEGENWEAKLERLASFGLEEPEILVLTGLLNRWMEETEVASVTVADHDVIPARSSRVIKCQINATTVGKETPVMFQPNEDWEADNNTVTLYTAVLDLKQGINESVEIKVKNNNHHDFHFRRGDILGSLEEVEIIEDSVIQYRAPDNTAGVRNIKMQTTPCEIGSKPDHGLVNPHVDCNVGLKSPAEISSSELDHSQEPTCPLESGKLFADLVDDDIPSASRPFYDQLKQMPLPELSVEQTVEVRQMLWEERGAFSQNPDDIGSVPELQLRLNTVDEIPVQRNYNAIPKPMYAEVRAQIQTMLDKGWIRKADSAWSSPIVLVKKKTGGMRLCCDFRLLNKKSIPDKHPIPRIAEALDTLQGSSIFSVLDLSRAYYQGYMTEDSREKTAFVTPWGFYEWIRIPFGLSNAVPTFQRFMEKLLEDYRDHFALPYLDDTIVHGKTVPEHIEQIRKVLRKFQEKGLKLNPAKCVLFKREVQYLGRIVNEGGYRMDEDSVKAVTELANKTFQTVGQVRKLMGLLSYHRRHVQSFAEIAKPLNDLLAESEEEEGKTTTTSKSSKKGVPSSNRILWTSEHQAALEKLISFITNPPILAYADYNSEFFLHTDASGAGLGAILYQEQHGIKRVIAYASRSLKPAERNYHSTKLEFMAMKWAICDRFRDYLSYADHFKVYTDNNPLLFVMSITKPNSSIHRWISELGEFNFTVFFRPGRVNRDADSLSRLPLDMEAYIPLCEEETSLDRFQMMVGRVLQEPGQTAMSTDSFQIGSKPDHEFTNIQPDTVTIISSKPDHWQKLKVSSEGTRTARPRFVFTAAVGNPDTIGDLKRDQEEDEYIGPTIAILKGDQPVAEPPTTESTATLHKLLLRERSRLFFDEDQILRRKASGGQQQVVLPLKHRDMVFKTLHTDMGHLGAERVMQLARQRVYWPKMRDDINMFTQQRCRCKAQRKIRQEAVAPLTSIHSSMPMEIVAIDFLHLEKSSTGCEYILLLVDHFTRYAQAYPTKNKSALTVAKNIFNDFVLRFGLPGRILHDQGREFDNSLFKELENFCGIVRSRTTPYHPQGNGACERMNSTLLSMMRTLSESDKPGWHRHVNKLVAAYNATTHSSTGYSPHFLLFGREPLLPLDVILGGHRGGAQRAHSYNNFVMEWESRMKEAYEIARQNVQKVKNYSEERWKRRLIASTLQPGDKVLIKNKRGDQTGPGKLRAYWEQDIYLVVSAHPNGVVYEVQKAQGGEKRVLHRNMLLSCEMLELDTTDSIPTQRDQAPPPALATRSKTARRQLPVVRDTRSDSSDSEDEFDYQFLADRPTTTQQLYNRQQEPRDGEDLSIEIQEAATSPLDMGTNAVLQLDSLDDNPSDHVSNDGTSDQIEQALDEDNPSDNVNNDDASDQVEQALDEDDSNDHVKDNGARDQIQQGLARDETASIQREVNHQRSGRTLRSHGKALTWNPSMGNSNVVLEESASNLDEVNPSDQTNDEGASDQIQQVLPHDEASYPNTSDPGEGPTNQVAGRSEDPTTTTSGLGWSDRRNDRSSRRPPVGHSYNELGSPIADDPVPVQGMASDAHVNVSTVHTSQLEEDEQGWWNWMQDAIGNLGIRLN